MIAALFLLWIALTGLVLACVYQGARAEALFREHNREGL